MSIIRVGDVNAGVPDASVTNLKVAAAAAINADKLADGATNKILTGTERTKLAGVADAATANSTDATLLARANHTGTQAQSTVTNLTTDLSNLNTTLSGNRIDGLDGVSAIGNVGASQAMSPGNGNGRAKLITLTAATCTLTFNNPAAGSSRIAFLELVVTQDATGGRLITWPGSVKWANATPPTLSTAAAAVDRFRFATYNGGTTWYGDTLGKAYA